MAFQPVFKTAIFMMLFLALCQGITAWGQSVQPLSLDGAIDRAIQQNAALQAERMRLGVAEARIVTAGARLNPALISDNGIAESTYRLGILQTFRLGGKRKRQVAVARAEYALEEAEVNVVLLDLVRQVRQAYTSLYVLQERQEIYRDIAETASRLQEIAQRREQAGDVPKVDVLQVEIAAVQASNDLKAVEGQMLEARQSLNLLLDEPIATEWRLAPPIVPLENEDEILPEALPLTGGLVTQTDDLDTLVQLALEHRPELEASRREIEVADRQLLLAKSRRIPDVTLFAGPDWVFGDEFSAFIMAEVDLPLFNLQQGPIQEAQARQAQLAARQEAVRKQVAVEVANAHARLQSHRVRLADFRDKLLPRARTLVEKARRSFEEGKSGILMPLNAQQAYRDTLLGYLDTLQQTQNALSDLERAVGVRL